MHFNLAADLQPIRNYFNRASTDWEKGGTGNKDIINVIVSLVKPASGSRILDVACGTGGMFESLLAQKPSLLRAIDLSPNMVRIAREKYVDCSTVELSISDFYAFDETEFDLIMVYNAYPHFLDKTCFARSLNRCLSSNGRFVIAHGRGRAHINACHSSLTDNAFSHTLLPCWEEAQRLGRGFEYDIMIDRDDLYLISGQRKN